MGHGDEIMATGMARGFYERGKQAAFGNGKKIIWGPHCKTVFENNPNIAPPGSEGASDLEWIDYYAGHRVNTWLEGNRWRWLSDRSAVRGEFFWSVNEFAFADRLDRGFVVIEPHVPKKPNAENKSWGFDRYAQISKLLSDAGYEIRQFNYGNRLLPGAIPIDTKGFRQAVVSLTRADLYIGPEGGLHHAAAAVETPAVVLMGGWVSPNNRGYAGHANLYVGDPGQPCGAHGKCNHCIEAMRNISVDQVHEAAMGLLQ